MVIAQSKSFEVVKGYDDAIELCINLGLSDLGGRIQHGRREWRVVRLTIIRNSFLS